MSRTVDPTEIRDTTDRLAHLLDRPRPGVLCAGDARRAGHPGRADRTARARAQDPGRRPRRGVRGVARRRRPHRRRTGWPARPAPPRPMRGGWSRPAGSSKPSLRSPGRSPGASCPPGRPKPIAGAAAADPGAQRRLLAKAKDGSLRELQDECRRTRVNAESDPDAAHRRAHAKRSCRIWTDADGVTGHLHLSGPVAEVARVDNAIRHRADQPLPPRPGRGPARTVGGLRLRRRHPAPDRCR